MWWREQWSKQALAWLGVGALSASCGGRAAEPRKSRIDGASGSTSSTPYGSAGKTSAEAGAVGAGGSPGSGGSGASGTTRGGSANASSAGGSAGLATGSSGQSTAAGGGGGIRVASGGFTGLAGSAGSTSYGGLGGMTAAGGSSAGRGTAGIDSPETAGAAGAPPVTEGGVMLDIFSLKSDPSRSCKTGQGLTYRIADTLNGHLIANGTDGVVLSCKIVNKSDGTFELSGSISGTATATSDAISYGGSGTAEPLEVPITFTFESHGMNAADESALTISYDSSDLGELEVPDTAGACQLMAAAKANGFLLADFECPLVVSPADDSSGCAISGALNFLYCDSE